MKKFSVIFFCILASCQSPYEIKRNSSDNLNNMNMSSEAKVKLK